MSDKLTSGTGLSGSLGRFDESNALRLHILSLSVLLAAILAVFAQTFDSMLDTWLHSTTFVHGLLVVPISAYLIWTRRAQMRRLPPVAFWPGALAMLALSLIWLSGDVLDIQVVMQLTVTGMIVMAVITVLGPRTASRIAFPLGYLFFAVPIGEALVPYLIDFTAAFTVKALHITGIPVFREGRYFSIPAGNFEVARACSGIRYLLAALALGTLYAYLSFRSLRKRTLFILFSIVMPIVANGFRAYFIVLIAQYVSLERAAGVDHIIFGWIFFGIVIFLMFLVGNRFRDIDVEQDGQIARADAAAVRDSAVNAAPHVHPFATVSLLVVSIGCVAAGPALAAMISKRPPASDFVLSGLPSDLKGWSAAAAVTTDWRPQFDGASSEAFARYSNGETAVDVAVVQYRSGEPGVGELATSNNSIANDDVWRIDDERIVPAPLDDVDGLRINESLIHSRTSRRIVWFLFDVDGEYAASDLNVKYLEAKSLFLGRSPVSSALLMSIESSGDAEADRLVMRDFLEAAYSPVRACIGGHGGEGGCPLAADRPGIH